MKAARILGKIRLAAFGFFLGVVVFSAITLLAQAFVQFHWEIRIDFVMLFLGQSPATELQVYSLYLGSVVFAGIVLVASEVALKGRRKWLATLGTIVLASLILAVPQMITVLIVWPAVAVELLANLLSPQSGPVKILVGFVAVVAFHAAVINSWFRITKAHG